MTDVKLYSLLEAFANYYWSVPISYVIERIIEWHPEVSENSIKTALQNDKLMFYHCSVENDGLEQSELVTEHLVALGGDDFEQFIAARIDGPYCDCDEETLLRFDKNYLDIPEKQAIIDFGKTELGLDDEWTDQLVHDCIFNQACALCDGKSWITSVLLQERFSKIHFRTIEQVKRFRDLGNKFFFAMPNPVLRGWKPTEVENPPVLMDDIPEKDEDIPDGRKMIDEMLAPYGGREKVREQLMGQLMKQAKPKKIGPNDPCPCGSGKKYKKCCGRG